MTRDEFAQNFAKAVSRSQEQGLLCVTNELKPPFSYLMKAKGGESISLLSDEQVISLLWRDGIVPEWVDIMPWESSSQGLMFRLWRSGRFAEGERLLYHVKEGYPPFHALCPWTPPDWESVEESGRFDLNWHLKREKN